MSKPLVAAMLATCVLASISPAVAQHHISCRPVAERMADMGCWILARETLRLSPQPLYWHLVTYPTRAAANSARTSGSTIIETSGKVWLLAVASENWRATGGEKIARLGPLSPEPAEQHTALYMETALPPGFAAPIHRHPGPEVTFSIAGEACIETPAGKNVERPGQPTHVVAGGEPMALVVTGTEFYRSLVLILHDASKPFFIPASDWTPKGLCRNPAPTHLQ